MRIISEEQLDFDDLLIMPKSPDKHKKLVSRSQVNLEREFKWYDATDKKKFTMSCIPYGPTNMGTVGTCEMAKAFAKTRHIACLEKHIPIERIDVLFQELKGQAYADGKADDFYCSKVIPSIGLKEDPAALFELYDKWHFAMLMIDVPNGYIETLLKQIELFHSRCPNLFIIAGNVVTADGAKDIMNAGATCVKCGIGNGSVCLTRLKTGVGRPQASTVIEIADAAHQFGRYCMCDGGVTNPGDVCKAFGCGADFVISGSLFAGCKEADGEVIVIDGKCYKQYYGMSSYLAQQKHFGGIRKYSASEGREKLVPLTGSAEDAMQEIDGGIRSACTYIGCDKMKNFSRQCTFYKVHKQLNTYFAGCQDIVRR